MHDRLVEKVSINKEIGGHSSVWARRAQIEGCKTYLSPYPSSFNKERLVFDESKRDLLVIAEDKDVSTRDDLDRPKFQDIHLVFEYMKGDDILGFVAPRSNRFYFVHDPNGSSFQQLESYHSSLLETEPDQRPYRHLFGGFQLMQKHEYSYAEERLAKMANQWFEMRQEVGPEGQRHMVHVEFGHYSDLEHFKLFEKYAVRNADSLGMNEVEMQNLLDFWSDKLTDINEESNSSPSLATVLELTDGLFK